MEEKKKKSKKVKQQNYAKNGQAAQLQKLVKQTLVAVGIGAVSK